MQSLKKALLDHNQNTPRYTSYPTAPHFSEAVGAERYEGWLQALETDQQVSLYIHIPYCQSLCWYCGCNTKATKQYGPVSSYVDVLLQEIELLQKTLGMKQSVSSIHFGGGSPSMLAPDDFLRIMAAIRASFHVLTAAEIAIEIDPRELTEPKVAAYVQAGVNRVSFGIQDFHENVQRAIGRRQPFYLVYDAVKLVRAYGIDHINMDLLYGLPHQTPEMMRANINFAHALAPGRIALFGYAHVPWMKKHMRLISESTLPSAEERLDLFEAAADQLSRKGYHSVGLDHFVRVDDPMFAAQQERTLHRNFQGYTTDTADAMIGLGVSSIGALPDGYCQNTADVRSYARMIAEGKLPIAKGKALSKDDRLRRAVIEKLMCYGTINLKEFCADYELPADYFNDSLADLRGLMSDGLVDIKDGMITTSAEVPQATRLVCAAFDTYLRPSKARHAQVA